MMPSMQCRAWVVAVLFGISGGAAVVAIAWPRNPSVLYIHVYSNRYNIEGMSFLPSFPGPWQRIATITAASGVPFFADLPGHYEPELEFEGTVRRHGSMAICDFSIWAQDPGLAVMHNQKSPVALNVLHAMGCEGCTEKDIEHIQLRFCISDSPSGGYLLRYGSPDPRLSQQEAISIATHAAQDKGFSIPDDEVPKAKYAPGTSNGLWKVRFTKHPPSMPAGQCEVTINDETKEVFAVE